MNQVNIHEAKTHLSQILKKVGDGELVIIARRNKPIAILFPLEENRPQRILDSVRDIIRIAQDFNGPLEDFEKYML